MDAGLLRLANDLGVKVEYAALGTRDGEYRHDLRLIRLQHGMTARLERSVFAHELGHAAFEHSPTMFGPMHAKQERMADEWAALHLIALEQYQRAEALHDGHVSAMAFELGVIGRLVDCYRNLLTRIGDSTYLLAKMGAGQWRARIRLSNSGAKG